MFWNKPKVKKKKRKRKVNAIAKTNLARAFERIGKLEDSKSNSETMHILEVHRQTLSNLEKRIAASELKIDEVANRKQNVGWKQDSEPIDNDKVLELEDKFTALMDMVMKMKEDKKDVKCDGDAKKQG